MFHFIILGEGGLQSPVSQFGSARQTSNMAANDYIRLSSLPESSGLPDLGGFEWLEQISKNLWRSHNMKDYFVSHRWYFKEPYVDTTVWDA